MAGAKTRDDRANNAQDDDDNENGHDARERASVEAYVHEHALEETLNAVINHVVADRPADPLLVLSSLLYGRATSKRGIFHIECKEVLDATGRPGVAVRVHTGKGVFSASCSSFVDGVYDRVASSHDEFAPTIPPEKQRFSGRGFRLQAEHAQGVLLETLLELEPADQAAIDAALVGMERDVGRNICLATSIAICHAGARYAERSLHEHVAALLDLPLDNVCVPMPLFSIVNGGALASSKLFVQEIFVAPVSATSLRDALQLGAELTQSVHQALEARGVGFANVGAFGGFAPPLATVAETFELLQSAVDALRTRLEGGDPSSLLLDSASVTPLRFEWGLDVAASAFLTPAPDTSAFPNDGEGEADAEVCTVFTYDTDKWVPGSSGAIQSSDELLTSIRSSVRDLELATVVDPFAPDDVAAFAALMSAEHDAPADDGDASIVSKRALGGDGQCRLQVVARATADTLERLHEERAANTVLLQLDQFATVSRLLQSVTDARRFGLAVMLGATAANARDAETVSAIAMGAGIGQVKFGGLAASECVERYNELALAADGPVPPAFVGSAYRR